jgi:hypothetical protein
MILICHYRVKLHKKNKVDLHQRREINKVLSKYNRKELMNN